MNSPSGQRERYEIRVTGHLAARWAAWFDGMTLTQQDDGTTVIPARSPTSPHSTGCSASSTTSACHSSPSLPQTRSTT